MPVAEESASHAGSCSTHGSGCGCGHHHAQEAKSEGKKSCGCGKLKPFRKIHTACGIAFAVFVLGHFAVLSTAWQPESFNQNSKSLHTLAANMPAVEFIALLVPAALLILCGLYLLWNAGLRYDVKKCNRGGKLRFFLQRISALAILGFLVIHVLSFSSWGNRLMGTQGTSGFHPDEAMTSAAESLHHPFGIMKSATPGMTLIGLMMTGVYALGIASLAYHFANGLWSAAIMWGFTPSAESQKSWLKVCVCCGLTIGALGIVALTAFISH